MALTSEQEEKIAQIIEAFDNGKRLSDLPNVSGDEPVQLVLRSPRRGRGKARKPRWPRCCPTQRKQSSYGVEFDTTVSSPDLYEGWKHRPA